MGHIADHFFHFRPADNPLFFIFQKSRDVGQEESSFSIKEESIITSSIIEKEEFEECSIEWDYLSKADDI